MPTCRLTAKARADLICISRYTQRTSDRDQRNRDMSRLDEAFHLLAQEPDGGRPCDEIRQGYRKYDVERHIIFTARSAPTSTSSVSYISVWTLTPDYLSKKLLQQAIDARLASGLSDHSMDELIADAEREFAADDLAEDV